MNFYAIKPFPSYDLGEEGTCVHPQILRPSTALTWKSSNILSFVDGSLDLNVRFVSQADLEGLPNWQKSSTKRVMTCSSNSLTDSLSINQRFFFVLFSIYKSKVFNWDQNIKEITAYFNKKCTLQPLQKKTRRNL